jgi:hypothetical protein
MESSTDPNVSAIVTHNGLASVLKAFVTTSALLKVLAGAFGAALVVASGLSAWTVQKSDSNVEKMAKMLADHIVEERKASDERAAAQKAQIEDIRQIQQKMFGIMLDGTVHIHPRGGRAALEAAAPPPPHPP